MLKYYRFFKRSYDIWHANGNSTSSGLFRQTREMYKLHKLNLLEPDEYQYYHFDNSDLSWEEKTRFLSRNQYYLFETNMNPRKDVGILNKLAFNLFAQSVGLPVPKLYGVFDHRFGYTISMNPLRTAEDLAEMFGKYPNTRFVIKPISSSRGHGIIKCESIADDIVKIIGEGEITVSELYGRLCNTYYSNQKYVKDSYIIEKALIQHPFFDNYCDSAVHPIRFVTYITNSGNVQILAIQLKMARKGSPIANIATSNLGAKVEFDGTLSCARSLHHDGIITFENHPDTGYPVRGQKIPHFDKAIEIARLAQSKIPFLRTIGWDIAITEKGPVIIEGNYGWDHDSTQNITGVGLIQGEFEKDLRELMAAHL